MRIGAVAAGACLAVAAVSCSAGDDDRGGGAVPPAEVSESTASVNDEPTVTQSPPGTLPDDGDPHVVGVVVTGEGSGSYSFDVTISSPYDGPDRYADAWRVVGADGEVHGIRELAHDHAAEQPFTRSLGGVDVPAGTAVVWVEARDLVGGWTGELFEVQLDV